jgi:pilus assembly protein Flp/PilA
MKSFAVSLKRFLRDEEGASMIEYGLLAALIAVVCIVAVTNIGIELNKVFTTVWQKLQGANAAANP